MTTQKNMPTDLLTLTETATLMGVHVRTVQRWVQRGWLPVYRHPMNGRVFLSQGEVRAAVRDKYESATQEL